MDFKGRILVQCLLYTVSMSKCWSHSLTVDISTHLTTPGDLVTLICRVTDVYKGLVTLTKSVRDQNDLSLKELVGIGGELTPLYSSFGRFSLIEADTGSVILYILNIQGVKEEDSGQYSCSAGESHSGESLQVYAKPQRMFFANLSAPSLLAVDENQTDEMKVECIVQRVMPLPHVYILINQHFNVTQHFQAQQFIQVHCIGNTSVSNSSAMCPLHYSYTVRVHGSLPASLLSNATSLTCATHLIGTSTKLIYNSTVQVNYRHSPVIVCDDLKAPLQRNPFTISCLVKYNPEPRSWCWMFSINHTEYEIRDRIEYTSGYTAYQSIINDTSSVISLRLPYVSEAMLTEYCLTVYQSLANQSHCITVAKNQSTDTFHQFPQRKVSSISSQKKATAVIFVILLVICSDNIITLLCQCL